VSQHLRLSPYIRFVLYIGGNRLNNQNITDGSDRLAYLEGLIGHLNYLLTTGHSKEEVAHFASHAPFWRQLVTLDESIPDRPRVRSADGVRTFLHFSPEEITILTGDGRRRDHRGLLSLQTGLQTPAFARMASRWAAGNTMDAFLSLGAEGPFEFDRAFIDRLVEIGVLEAHDPEGTAAERTAVPSSGSWVSWLGHAAVAVGTPRTCILVDPMLPPRIAWQPEERKTLFGDDVADSVLLDPYGPDTPPIRLVDLPPPRAVCITHQDTDHFDLSTLMLLPEETAIVVPRAFAGSRFDVDLCAVIRNFLGDGRRVVALAHGETCAFEDVRITAFPFTGEVPVSVPHSWNSYLLETRDGAVAFCADCAVGPLQLEFLENYLSRARKPLLLMGRLGGGTSHGYHDHDLELYNPHRGWAWYTPLWALFAPTPGIGISPEDLQRLVQRGLKGFFPYALGSTPWLRARDGFLLPEIGSMPLDAFQDVSAEIKRAGTHVPPLRYGRPFSLAEL
jgi:L-ascorbate metabolism protein UlaG (beta-lactamase superfamily)